VEMGASSLELPSATAIDASTKRMPFSSQANSTFNNREHPFNFNTSYKMVLDSSCVVDEV